MNAQDAIRTTLETSSMVLNSYLGDLSDADLLVSIEAAFTETWQNPVAATRQFAAAKKHEDYKGSIYIGSRYSLTASNCDTWVANKPGTSGALAMALLALVAEKKGATAKVKAFVGDANAGTLALQAEVAPARLRSEEHTSELQSH